MYANEIRMQMVINYSIMPFVYTSIGVFEGKKKRKIKANVCSILH